jgi:hypothetical protein
MFATKIYFSYSFHDEDRRVVNAIRGAFDELKKPYYLEDVTTERPTSEQLYTRLVGPMADVDIVVCIFTRRHPISTNGGPAKYTAPPYVVAEAAAAYTQKKRVLVFVEKGLPLEELGFVDAFNPQYQEVDRDLCGHTEYDKKLRSNIEAALKPLINLKLPPYTFEMYEVHVTLYPNGYVLLNSRFDVRMPKNEPIKHFFGLHPDENERITLPTATELYRIGREHVSPIPTAAFTAFASSSEKAKLVPVDRDEVDPVREYRVELGGSGVHHYEWMWGTPNGFDLTRPREWTQFSLSKRSVERVRVVLRIHRQLVRDGEPAYAQIVGDRLDDGDPRDAQLAMLEAEAQRMGPVRENPLFRCHEVTLNEIARGLDLVVLY